MPTVHSKAHGWRRGLRPHRIREASRGPATARTPRGCHRCPTPTQCRKRSRMSSQRSRRGARADSALHCPPPRRAPRTDQVLSSLSDETRRVMIAMISPLAFSSKGDEMAASVSLPKVGEKSWFALRAKAAAAPSTKFTPATVAALLSMAGTKSASDNVVGPLRRLGLIEDDGALTDRGNKWRIDSSYADACEEILKSVYPPELRSLTDDSGQPDRVKVATWLQHQGQGDSNAKQMAATYAMIASKSPAPASPPAGTNGSKAASAKPRAARAPAGATSSSAAPDRKPKEASVNAPIGSGSANSAPTIHLDIQVHIPPAASADQIDQIFASMAKHLYRQ